MRKSDITTGAYFDSLSSAATTAGQNGVSLWVARHIPVNPEAAVPVYLSAADTRVSHQTSRILIAHIRKARFDLHAVVLHAVNQAHASPEEIHAWWAEVRTAMHSSIPHGSGVVVFADVNGRVGSIVDQVVGPSRAQEEDLPGYLFRSLLAEWSLCLPCTYEHIASSHQPWLPEEDWHTWTSNAGGEHRIDFLVIPRAALNYVRRCCIPPEIDLPTLNMDHRPVAIEAVFIADAAPRRQSLRKQHFNDRMLRDPEQAEQVRQLIRRIPPVSWEVNASQHLTYLQSAIVDAVSSACPQTHAYPKKP